MPTQLRTMLAVAVSLSGLFVASVAAAQTEPESAGRPVNSGFALQTSLVVTPLMLDGAVDGFPSFEGGLSFGYKYDRFVFGVGFDFTNWSESEDFTVTDPSTGNPVTGERTRRMYSFIVAPELQVAIARSKDLRAELFGSVSVGLGTWDSVTTTDPDPNPLPTPVDDELRLRVRWRAAPGVRYWVHPHVAMSLVTGISGNYRILDNDTDDESETIGLTALYTQVGLLGVF